MLIVQLKTQGGTWGHQEHGIGLVSSPAPSGGSSWLHPTRRQGRPGRRQMDCLVPLGSWGWWRWCEVVSNMGDPRTRACPAAGAVVKWIGELCFSRLPRHCKRCNKYLIAQSLTRILLPGCMRDCWPPSLLTRSPSSLALEALLFIQRCSALPFSTSCADPLSTHRQHST